MKPSLKLIFSEYLFPVIMLLVLPGVETYAETSIYKISYGPIRIGTLSFDEVEETSTTDSTKSLAMTIKSNPDLFFLDFYSNYEAVVDSKHRPLTFKSYELAKKDSIISLYIFDYHDSLIYVRMDTLKLNGITLKSTTYDTIVFSGPSYDPLSFLHSLRNDTMMHRLDHFYSFYGLTYGRVDFGETERRKDFGLDQTGRLFEGQLRFKGVAGWTGYFAMWLAEKKEARVLEGRLKIFLGSIRIKLEEIISVDRNGEQEIPGNSSQHE